MELDMHCTQYILVQRFPNLKQLSTLLKRKWWWWWWWWYGSYLHTSVILHISVQLGSLVQQRVRKHQLSVC